MKNSCSLVCALCGIFCVLADAQATNPTPVFTAPHIRAQLIIDTTPAERGDWIRAGVQFEIEPGWHIYYREPGSIGLPTKISWHAPAALTRGSLLWPAPKTFEYANEKSYGYEGTVLLYSDGSINERISDETITAEVSWLLCNDECIPGHATLSAPLNLSTLVANRQTAVTAERVADNGSADQNRTVWHLM